MSATRWAAGRCLLNRGSMINLAFTGGSATSNLFDPFSGVIICGLRGEDPVASKRQVVAQRKIEMKPKVPTFDECATQYIASHRAVAFNRLTRRPAKAYVGLTQNLLDLRAVQENRAQNKDLEV